MHKRPFYFFGKRWYNKKVLKVCKDIKNIRMQKSLFFFFVFFFGLFLVGDRSAIAITCELLNGTPGTCVVTCPSGIPFEPINTGCGIDNGGCCANNSGSEGCGNGICYGGETATSCPADCAGNSGSGVVCNNNGTCNAGETSANCSADCSNGGVGSGGTGSGTGGTGTGGTGTGSSTSAVRIPSASAIGLSDATVIIVLLRMLNWLLIIAGVIAVIAFVISGIQYLVSAGNDSIIETAKRNMIYSIVGVIVMLSGLVIVNAIDMWFTGSSVPF